MNAEVVVGNRILFIQGVPKTGSSTLVGILNCHPDILLLYETKMMQTGISKYGTQILGRYPEARQFFYNAHDIGEPYKNFKNYLEQRTHREYCYFGDKLIDFDSNLTSAKNLYPTIFTMRDIRSWLCKEQIIKRYRTDLDIVPVVIDYLRYVIRAHHHPQGLSIWLEDLCENNSKAIKLASDFLQINLKLHTGEWWKKIGCYSNQDPKSMCRWYSEHLSSKIKPSRLDTMYELSSHPFWDKSLSIFEKYYRVHHSASFHYNEQKDLNELEELRTYSPLPIQQCYARIKTERFGISKNSIVVF